MTPEPCCGGNSVGRAERAAPLRTLRPDELALDAVGAVLGYLDVLAIHLFPPVRLRDLRGLSMHELRAGGWRERGLDSVLGQSVRDVTRFAQSGAGELAEVPGALQSILEAVYTAAVSAERHYDLADRIDRGCLPGPLGVVARAALARYRIELGAEVSVRELAVLGDADEDDVRSKVDLGGHRVEVPAWLARQYLRAQGVAEFGQEK